MRFAEPIPGTPFNLGDPALLTPARRVCCLGFPKAWDVDAVSSSVHTYHDVDAGRTYAETACRDPVYCDGYIIATDERGQAAASYPGSRQIQEFKNSFLPARF